MALIQLKPGKKILLGSLLVLLWNLPVQGQADLLTRAQVSKLRNQVQLLLRNKSPRPARIKDILVPLDALSTKARSQADLSFNEGSYTSIGSNSIFRFKPGMRRYQLPGGGLRAETVLELKQGVAVVMVPPGGSTTKVETTQGSADIFPPESLDQATPQSDELSPELLANFPGSALAIVAKGDSEAQFFNLTPHLIAITDPAGTRTIFLRGGQTVAISDGVIGPIQTFDLKKFYQTTQLAATLAPQNADLVAKEPEQVQKTLRILRKQAAIAIQNQELWVEGLCSLNSRASGSTLSTNCITTGNDPIDKFEDIRETLPPREDEPGNDIPEPVIPDPEPVIPDPDPVIPDPEPVIPDPDPEPVIPDDNNQTPNNQDLNPQNQ